MIRAPDILSVARPEEALNKKMGTLAETNKTNVTLAITSIKIPKACATTNRLFFMFFIDKPPLYPIPVII